MRTFSSSETFLGCPEAQIGKARLHSLEWFVFAHLTLLIQLRSYLSWFSVPAPVRPLNDSATDVEAAADQQEDVKLSSHPHCHFSECLSLTGVCSRQVQKPPLCFSITKGQLLYMARDPKMTNLDLASNIRSVKTCGYAKLPNCASR